MALQHPSEKLEWVACPMCDSSSAGAYIVGEDRQYKNDGSFSYVKCHACGLVYLNPRPTPEWLAEFYPIDEYYTYTAGPSQGALGEFKDRMRVWVARNHLGYESLLREEKKSGLLDWICHNVLWPMAFAVLGDKFRRILPYTEGARILDVGCGSGDYLLFMRNLGWDAWGVEIEAGVCEMLQQRGVQMHQGELQEARFPDGFFDWVTMNHSLEHVPNPRGVILEVARILKPGGSVFVGVPNIDSVQRRVFGRYWYFLGAPLHLCEFSTETLRKLLELAELEVESVRFISGTQGLLGSLQYVLNSWAQRVVRVKVVNYALRDNLLARMVVSPLARLIDTTRRGDCIEVVARKRLPT